MPGMRQAARSPVLAVALVLAFALLGWIAWQGLGALRTAQQIIQPPASTHGPAGEPPREVALPEVAGTERVAGERTAEPEGAEPALVDSGVPARGRFAYRGFAIDVDLHQPVPDAELAFEREGRELSRCRSDEQGRFRTPEMREEAHSLRIVPPAGFVAEEERLELSPDRGEILVALHRDPATLAGPIRGEFLSESGPWTAQTLPRRGEVLLDLVPIDGSKWGKRANLIEVPDEQGRIRLTFEFESLPKGEYLITLSSISAWRWNPTSLRVAAPAQGLTFLRYDLDRSSQLVFQVRDRASGERIEKFDVRALQLSPSEESGVFLHTGPLETSAVPDDAHFQWSLSAEGYRPVFGDETAFVRRGGERVAEIALERGWATKVLVLVRDPLAKPGAHATVELDGKAVGVTGEDGMLAIAAPKPPEKLAVRLPGWRMTNDPLQSYNGKPAAQRGGVTIVVLEKEK